MGSHKQGGKDGEGLASPHSHGTIISDGCLGVGWGEPPKLSSDVKCPELTF